LPNSIDPRTSLQAAVVRSKGPAATNGITRDKANVGQLLFGLAILRQKLDRPRQRLVGGEAVLSLNGNGTQLQVGGAVPWILLDRFLKVQGRFFEFPLRPELFASVLCSSWRFCRSQNWNSGLGRHRGTSFRALPSWPHQRLGQAAAFSIVEPAESRHRQKEARQR
jgi:hypothetical protein